jgi:protein-S-isoprenylcysteine O-methyltransferase Ste14
MFYQTIGITETLLCCIWLLHYIHRTFVWPLRAKLRGKQMGVGVMSMALLFNFVNITLQCIWIFILGEYTDQWLLSPLFIVGIIIFLLGMLINIKSDNILMNLRKSRGNGYHVPKGFFFKYVSNPNYFGEIIEWFGWSLLSMSPAGFVFFIWTTANLVPRARSNNEWSKSNIPDYPKNRKSIIPFIY